MTDDTAPRGPLEGLRVVEIGDRGEVAGKLLADAGADVIRVEPPAGARSRHAGPFAGDVADPNRSLAFHARNTSKRSVTLDVAHPEAADAWRRLVGWSEVVVESCGPGVLDAAGAGYDAVGAAASTTWCSITPFGLTGPWRDFAATDLVSLALGGPMMSTGYEDHDLPPIRSDGEHSLAIAGEYAVTAILAARWMAGGEGGSPGPRLIDVSIHEAVSATTEGAFPNWEYLGLHVQRQTGRHAAPDPSPPWQYACADGEYILLMGGGVPRERRIFEGLLAWMDEVGFEGANLLRRPEYGDVLYQDPRANPNARRVVAETIGDFVQTRPAEEVYRRGQALHLPWGRIRRPEQNLDDPHWEERGFWWRGAVEGHEGEVRYPGAPYRFLDTPVRMRRRPPLLGEHNHEVYAGMLGIDPASLPGLARAGAI